jgi:hypothetical protein
MRMPGKAVGVGEVNVRANQQLIDATLQSV